VRIKIARLSAFITLGVFLVLWYVPFINDLFWETVIWLGRFLQFPFDLVLQGYSQFRFWER
jgi:hypothetical protein